MGGEDSDSGSRFGSRSSSGFGGEDGWVEGAVGGGISNTLCSSSAFSLRGRRGISVDREESRLRDGKRRRDLILEVSS